MIIRITGEKSKISTREKGITLIALVVTIIVLLILAGVSIQMLTGQNGILKRAKEAKEKTKRAEVIEIAQMEIYDKQVEGDGKITAKELHDILDEYFENVPELEKNGTWKGFPNNFKEPLVSKEDKKIEVEIGEIYKGTIETIIKAEEVVEDLSTYIGTYVNYGVNLDESEETPDWRIFYAQNVEGEGNRVYLIAADYVPIDKVESKVGMNKLNDLSANWTTVPNLKDISIGKERWSKLFKDGECKLADLSGNAKCLSALRETTNWAKFAEGIGGQYAIGGPTAHMWCEAWNTIVNTDDGYAKINVSENLYDSGYKFKGISEEDYVYMNMNGTTSPLEPDEIDKLSTDNIYSLFFPHTTVSVTANGKSGNCYGYWLTSPSAISRNNLLHTWWNGCMGYFHSADERGCSIRPVICLSSRIYFVDSGTKEIAGKPVYNIK